MESTRARAHAHSAAPSPGLHTRAEAPGARGRREAAVQPVTSRSPERCLCPLTALTRHLYCGFFFVAFNDGGKTAFLLIAAPIGPEGCPPGGSSALHCVESVATRPEKKEKKKMASVWRNGAADR
ncbi:hypothetical protein EYF80_066398 [Liparis tanakae]|uniref:Uncharacterized protein n=1 Tax=Liparis tanakae TaxID=230148 RepID=A0A4Z2E560_9TELE|nr:hypothetical protein EYF80_066398 [Liparis tanakae]